MKNAQSFPDPGVKGDPQLLGAIHRRQSLNPGTASVVHLPGGTVITPKKRRQTPQPAVEELHPWKLRLVDGEWEVYGEGSTVEKRWSGDVHTVTGLDAPLTLGESSNYVYARATATYGVLSDFTISVEETPLDRVVSSGGYQTELNILIGLILSGEATQRLRDPVNVTLTCVAGVPAWVPLLSEGLVPEVPEP
jgi:hypothetical protein